MKIAKATTMDRLRAASIPIMVAYKTDLEHDAKWIEQHPGKPFIHVCTDTSTHIFPCAQDYGDNAQQRYLFGRATPQQIFAGNLSCIEMLGSRDPVLFHYFHSSRGLILLGALAAYRYYQHHITNAETILMARRRAS